MKNKTKHRISRREFTTAAVSTAAFTIVPRHVLGGTGFTPPSDKINLAVIGLGRQGMAVMMNLLQLPEIQVIAVCDVNRGSKEYAEYNSNAMLTAARQLLGAGFETWGEDWNSPGTVQLTKSFSTSIGIGGREPAKRLVEAYYGSHTGSEAYKGCTAYMDFRELLEKESGLDAVYVATPDHWHAPISIAAMRKGKHVLCQKPMAHSIGEARRMAAVAREMKVATALPVNNPYTPSTQTIIDWITDGAIGRVREVHNWSSRPYWPQGVERPKEAMPVPENLNWDMWVGPAPMRPYNKAYLPFVWRGWYDFGCGSFGDMGCYSFAGVFKILGLTPPTVVEACSDESYEETFPQASIVHLDFPAREGRGEIRMSWYDGGLHPPRPAGISERDERMFRHRQEGVMYVGDKGILLAGFNGQNPHVYPASPKYVEQPRPEAQGGQAAQRRDSAIDAWITAVKKGQPAQTNFEIQAPVTEAFLLGCMAQRLPGEKLVWDTAQMKVTNNEKANGLVDPAYRNGFTA
ncbi:MAG: Gfo/Idh/MocA family oxidoreductase [Acidobacteria bacterium]|nr:Gfo/Idh/MocA family oxidoreductase [Acidobacteriota bacterium]